MASLTEQLLKASEQARAELLAALAPKDVIYQDLNEYVTRYRFSCEKLILHDFDCALDNAIEQKLWDAHLKVNKRYQKLLSLTRCRDGKKTPVEYRKTAKRYLDFIKASQRFYREYIQKLASTFGGIPQLDAIAHSLKVDGYSAEAIVEPSQSMRHAILLSSHQTLVRLGDLSRYRETELGVKEPNWGPAIGYYDLAGTIYPPSGVSHNQLAVIAKHREQHLGAIYHLYRALAAEESHPMAKGNLELEFKKVEAAWAKGEPIATSVAESPQGSGQALENWFMRLHARCYKGADFSEHDELENEVLSQLAVDLKERSLESLLNKIVLISITAQFSAGEDFRSPPNPLEKKQALLFFLRLNVRTFFTLLQLLQSELEAGATGEADLSPTHTSMNGSSRISAVARRILPALRQYSSWLTTNVTLLTSSVGESALQVQIKEMWKIYANTLTILASTFQVAALPALDYLLEEDEDTICFKPFIGDTSARHVLPGSTDLKPMFHAPGIERQHPNVEMWGRIREFVIVGLRLAYEIEEVPIDFVNSNFVYREEGVPSELLASPAGHPATLASTPVRREEIPYTNGNDHADGTSMVADHLSHGMSMGTSAEDMVDKIVEDDTMDLGSAPGLVEEEIRYNGPAPYNRSSLEAAGNETSYGTMGSITAADLVRRMRSGSTPQASPRPRLPSIYNTAFAPQADEEDLSCPGTAKRNTPSHSQQSSQHSVLGSFSQSNSQKLPVFFQQQPNGYHQVSSSMNSLGTPSSIPFSQRLPRTGLTTHSPRISNINYEDSGFRSSSILSGSHWGSARQTGIMATPPNGQGNGYGG